MKRKQNESVQRQFQVGTRTIAYTLTLAKRKSVSITIRPDMSVAVRAPQNSHEAVIDEILQKRAGWIMRHLQKFAERPAPQARATTLHNNTYLFLGQRLPITVIAVDKRTQEGVSLQDGKLLIQVKNAEDTPRIDTLLDKWRREQAAKLFSHRIAALFPAFQSFPVKHPALKIRRMKARWGSCSTSGTVTLNLRLIHLEAALIDYVVMHELCHLVEHNHSQRFYALLTRMMPDWRARRQKLNEQGMPD